MNAWLYWCSCFCDIWSQHHSRVQCCSWWLLHHCVAHTTYPLICSSTSPIHLFLLSVMQSTALGFQKARLMFFLPFPFLSSTSKSTLPLTSGLQLCLTASLPCVKMSASAWQAADAYQWVIGRRHVTALLCGDGVGDIRASRDYTLRSLEGRVGRVLLCHSAMGACLCQNILV